LYTVADWLRWKVVVERELKRRNLVRVRDKFIGAKITPARGFRVIEACACERDGKVYLGDDFESRLDPHASFCGGCREMKVELFRA
jgi:hypothetical protein